MSATSSRVEFVPTSTADRPGEDGETVERRAQVLDVRLDRLDP
jgi:hypothetical protein